MDKTILDNLKGQEIKELINENKISLNDLDTPALEKLFGYELDMLCTDEGDEELLNACAARMDELNGPLMSKEEYFAALHGNIGTSANVEKIEPICAQESKPARAVKRRHTLKRIWLVAAVIAVLMAVSVMTASAFGYNVFEYFGQVIGLPVGDKVDKGYITLVNYGETDTYSSIDDLLSDMNIEILYPTILPDNVQIERVCISEGENGGDFIELITSDSSTYISVDTNAEYKEIKNYTKQHIVGDCTYLIFEGDNFAVCYYKDCYYYISSNNYDNLILIINNLSYK